MLTMIPTTTKEGSCQCFNTICSLQIPQFKNLSGEYKKQITQSLNKKKLTQKLPKTITKCYSIAIIKNYYYAERNLNISPCHCTSI